MSFLVQLLFWLMMKKEFKSADSKVPCNSVVPNSVTLLSVQGDEKPNILTITLI
ncbi:MAG: hypothetical protein ACXADC_12605 [Candidatus Thorarchaeota archaeon]